VHATPFLGAIPADARPVATRARSQGEAIGIEVQDSDNKVVGVDMGSPANRSGLQHGDVIIKLNGVTCDKPLAELKHLLDGSDTVMLTVKRGRAHDAVTFTPRRSSADL
jgi:C-terminal processing protease CtpA/Prc